MNFFATGYFKAQDIYSLVQILRISYHMALFFYDQYQILSVTTEV